MTPAVTLFDTNTDADSVVLRSTNDAGIFYPPKSLGKW